MIAHFLDNSINSHPQLILRPCSLHHTQDKPLPPWALFKLGVAIATYLPIIESKLTPPHIKVLQVATAFAFTKALYVAAKANIADLLFTGPKTTSQLAAAAKLNEPHLFRVLRALESLDIFKQQAPGLWINTSASDCLRKEATHSVYHAVLHNGLESYDGHSKLWESMQLGCNDMSFQILNEGSNLWDWYSREENAEIQQNFNDCMVEYSSSIVPAVLADFDWSRFSSSTVNDIGGGTGGILSKLMRKYPNMKGVLFERDSVIEEAKGIWKDHFPEMLPRAALVAGDFFKDPITPADALIMKHILHDWSDEDCVKVLKNVRKTACMKDGSSTLLLIECVLPEEGTRLASFQAYLDLQMMAIVGGKERTEKEWGILLESGGFMLKRVHSLRAPFSIVEAIPV